MATAKKPVARATKKSATTKKPAVKKLAVKKSAAKKVVAENSVHLEKLIDEAIKKYGVNCDLNYIDVSNVTNMRGIFNSSRFNGDISQWDVSNVTDMSHMFQESAFNGDISQWDVSNVNDMTYMFYYATSFNGDVSQWVVPNLIKKFGMFTGTPLEEEGKLPKWYKPAVKKPAIKKAAVKKTAANMVVAKDEKHLAKLIDETIKKNGVNCDLNFIDVSNVECMVDMFVGTPLEEDGKLPMWYREW